MAFSNFLKEIDLTLSKEYTMECFKDGVFGNYKEPDAPIKTPSIVLPPDPEIDESPYFKGLISFKTFPPGNPVLLYVQRRQIPEEKIQTFFLVKNFYRWASFIEPVFEKFPVDHPRLVIPYYDAKKKLLGFACRAFGKEEPKYIQLRLDKEKEFLYGMDTVDFSKRIHVVEGQIDSMFLENSIAVGNANYGGAFLKAHKDKVVILPDNDWRRNKDVCKQLEKAIGNGFSICIFPDHWKKDINDICKSGTTAAEIQAYVDQNTVSGLSAKLQFTLEKKC